MGIQNSSIHDLIEKVTSWFSWGESDKSWFSEKIEMPNNSAKMCCECDSNFTEVGVRNHCQSCGRLFCEMCIQRYGYGSPIAVVGSDVMKRKSCKFCEKERKFSGKIYPSLSLRESLEPPSPRSSVTSFSGYPSPLAFTRCSSSSDGEETEDFASQVFRLSGEYYPRDVSDIDTNSIRVSDDFYDFKSMGTSPSDSPSRNNYTSDSIGPRNDGPFDHDLKANFKTPEIMVGDLENTNLSISSEPYEENPLDFENNGLIWFPPPPENDETDGSCFVYDDDDDIEESVAFFSSSMFSAKEKHKGNKEPLREVIEAHFRALVSQLLQGEGIIAGEDWLDIVTKLAWQAANYVKPNTSRGGSMDPGDYVKVKCIATGSPSDSLFTKGVVCTKNITHKRMTSQYKTPRLLILGGALEYQRVPNQLSSFDTLLQQEIDHLKMIISKIEAHRPNVVLVEKSVSSYAQEYLLAKEISLVLNVKRPLLERIARCTGALITPSVDSISSARLGHCELFRVERVSEDLDSADQSKRKPAKTLMFFEGCPRRLGCTVLLKGTSLQELKKLKDVFHYAVFAAYHLSLETSFLADEGASLPKLTLKSSITPEGEFTDYTISPISNSYASTICHTLVDVTVQDEDSAGLNGEVGECDALSDISDGTLIELWNLAAHVEVLELSKSEKIDDDTETSINKLSATDSHQSLLVSFSSRCVLKGYLCERSRLMRIKFYGCFDKPLGRYLQDDLFNQKMYCKSCNELAEAHLQCYTHQQGSLTISVRRIPNLELPGERDGKIWMWHRCLRCAHIDGIPPATRRVIMSDAACGLSFGKFLELSFSNHATANRLASCGHSLQRDCLRYYGSGSMVVLFRYTPIDILSVCLPPSMIEFNNHVKQDWITKESEEIFSKMVSLYAGISNFLYSIEQRNTSSGRNSAETTELHNHIMELKILVEKERNDYGDLLQLESMDSSLPGQQAIDILELNRLRRSLIISLDVWDSRLSSIDSFFKTRDSKLKKTQSNASSFVLKDLKVEVSIKNGKLDSLHEHNEESNLHFSETEVLKESMSSPSLEIEENCLLDKEINVENTESDLSDKIDSAWTGTHQHHVSAHDLRELREDGKKRPIILIDSPPLDRLKSTIRVHSFDSAIRVQERIHKELNHPTSLHLSTHKSFHDSSELTNMVNSYSQKSPRESHKLMSCASQMAEGARLLLPQTGKGNIVIAVYDNEPTSIISYALSSKEYEDLVAENLCEFDRSFSSQSSYKESYNVPSFSTWQSFGSLDLEYMQYSSFGSEDASSSSLGSVYQDNTKKSPHLRISFGDSGKVKFSVTCYFAKQFDLLRKKCCTSEVDFMRSLSRCKSWSAQGGKSNVYFAKSFDDRFIIKQVTKTELDSFREFAPEYFKYLADSLGSGSPTCLAKIFGIYQVSVKHLKGGKETKMELMVMENLFFQRNISRVYDLKGSVRSRYNPDTTGANTVLLDMNLIETLSTKPIFLGSKAKRNLERAVWNDTSFLASVDVMDYSLLVGVDEERNELVIGIIDIMRQYSWDKHLETWVKASGILGGPKNVSPTIISPKQYKKRFRKAMTAYFLTVPDQWPS